MPGSNNAPYRPGFLNHHPESGHAQEWTDASNEAKLSALPDGEGIKIISALTHREIVQMLARTGQQPDLFDQTKVVEIADPDDPGRRYCLCRNPATAARETTTRRELLARTRLELERIALTALKSQRTKRPAGEGHIGTRIGTILGTMEPKERRWTLHNIIEILKAQRRETISLCGTTFDQITEPSADQARLLTLLQPPAEPT